MTTSRMKELLLGRTSVTGALYGGIGILGTLLLASQPAQAGLLGSTVTVTEYAPNLSTIYSGPVSKLVDGTVEVPAGLLTTTGSLQVTDNQITYHIVSGTTAPGTFDGFVFNFSGAPPITDVTIDPSSSPLSASTIYAVSSNQIEWNFASPSLFYSAGENFILDVQTSPVPLSASAWLLLAGLSGLGVIARSGRSNSPGAVLRADVEDAYIA